MKERSKILLLPAAIYSFIFGLLPAVVFLQKGMANIAMLVILNSAGWGILTMICFISLARAIIK